MWGPRGSHAESAATWDKIGVKTVESPIVIGFVSWGTSDIRFCGWGMILYLANKLRDLACTFSFSFSFLKPFQVNLMHIGLGWVGSGFYSPG